MREGGREREGARERKREKERDGKTESVRTRDRKNQLEGEKQDIYRTTHASAFFGVISIFLKDRQNQKPTNMYKVDKCILRNGKIGASLFCVRCHHRNWTAHGCGAAALALVWSHSAPRK